GAARHRQPADQPGHRVGDALPAQLPVEVGTLSRGAGPVLGLITAVFTVMLVASLESLLSAVAVDKMGADRPLRHL
ncbi:hypothetical protein, partial [Streptomyces beijiangensis]|nr:hypothetical protein [Streptomyces beijiangensis]